MGNYCCCPWFKAKVQPTEESSASAQEPPQEEDPAELLRVKGAQLYRRYTSALDASKDPEDLAQAVDYYSQASKYAPPGHPRRLIIVRDLVFALLDTGPNTLSDLEVIGNLFAELSPHNTDLERQQACAITFDLGRLYGAHYATARSWERDEVAFERAVFYYRASVDYSAVVQDKVETLLTIAQLHHDRKQDLHYKRALDAAEEARNLCPDKMIETRYNISKALFEVHKARSNAHRRIEDLEKAIAECINMLGCSSAESERCNVLDELVCCVQVLLDVHQVNSHNPAFEIEHGPLHEAFNMRRDIEEFTDEMALKATTTLADVLAHSKRDPSINDLDKAIILYRAVVKQRPSDCALLRKTADTIWLRCTNASDFSPFEDVVTLYQKALSLLETVEPANNTSIGSEAIELANNIAFFYSERSDMHGKTREGKELQVKDLKSAHQWYSKAAELCTASNSGRGSSFKVKVTQIEDNIIHLTGPGERQLGEDRGPGYSAAGGKF